MKEKEGNRTGRSKGSGIRQAGGAGFIRLSTSRLLLRDHVPADLADYHAVFSDETVMYYPAALKTNALAETEIRLQEAISEIGHQDRRCFFLKVEEADTGRHAGECGFTVLERTPAGCLVEPGWFLRPDFQGRGYAVEAARMLIRFAFDRQGAWRVMATCIQENAASERVMQRCGMVREAVFRSSDWHDGRLKNRVVYGLLAEEWRARDEG